VDSFPCGSDITGLEARLLDRLSQCSKWGAGVVAFLALVLTISSAASAQDRRTVVEPSFPASCAVLSAQLQIADGEPSSETAFDTARIQSALSSCPSGQAVELVRSGGNSAFLVQPIDIPSGVALLVDGGITVFASRNPADYQAGTVSASLEACGTVGTIGNGCKSLFSVNHGNPSTGSALMGYGVIDGRGQDKLLVSGSPGPENWWDLANDANPNGDQNNVVLLQTSAANSFTLYKISLRNSPMFHVVWKGTGLTAWGVKIATPYTSRNTDGIDPSGSDITVTHSSISDGDDNVAVSASSASAHITVSNLQTYSGHGISVGSFTKGGLTNLLVDTVNMAGTAADGNATGLRLKSAADRGGLVQNVTYQNLCIKDVAHALELNPFYNTNSGTLIPQFENVVVRNAHFMNRGKVQLQGFDAAHATSVTLDNVVFDSLLSADLSPAPQFAAVTVGPGQVSPQILQSLTGTGVTESGTAGASITRDCTGAFPLLVGELYLSTPSATNLQSLTFTGPASFNLEAVVQPAMSQVSYGAWTGVPALQQPVNFLEGGTIVGSGALTANGTLAVASLSNVGGGTHTYTAQYPGDSNYPAQLFGSVTVTVNAPARIASSIAASVPASASFGGSLSLSATVSGSGATATGSVQFSADGVSLGSATLSGGTATLTIAALNLPAGNHRIVASYAGDATYSPSDTSAHPAPLAVGSAPTSVALTVPAQAIVGAPLQISATVTSASGTPDGSVTFSQGSTAIQTVALVAGTASLHVTPGAAGTLTLSAAYSGSSGFAASSSSAASVAVTAPFTLAATPGVVTLSAAGSTAVSISVAPQAGFSGQVDLTCTSTAPNVSCSLAQSSATLTGTAAVTVSATISGSASAARFAPPAMLPATLFAWPGRRRKRRYAALALFAICFGLLLSACGGSSGSGGGGSQLVTITGSNGAASVSTQVTVNFAG
jgi:Glycosyl hydrolases family 28/Bacterial Ig-like domain (group 3)